MNTLLHDFPSPNHGFIFNYDSAPLCTSCNLNPFRPIPSPCPESPPCSANSGSHNSEFNLLTAPALYRIRNIDPPCSDLPPIPEDLDPSTLRLDYINEMLMTEDMEEKTCMLQDCLALQAAEKSFYEALVDHCPPSVRRNAQENPDDGISLVHSLDPFTNLSDWCFTSNSNSTRKNYEREDYDCLEEGRSNKQFANYLPDCESSGMFDDLFLDLCNPYYIHPSDTKRKGKKSRKRVEVVDLWTLLIQCAQAVAIIDHRSYTELLKQIRQNSSESGSGMQRLAHYFACGIETRLAEMGAPVYSPMLSNKTSAADILKAYRMYCNASPFTKMSNFYANRMILKVAEKATTLHIVDFGICYGLQWPCLIRRLSERPGGPPMLRITGIELPQPGFKPAERVEETGHRLRKFSERFNVPFEYNVIAKKWETIQLSELNLREDEVIAVNSIYRFRHLPDDTMIPNSARDIVLNLVKDIKPDIFTHGVLNGTYSPPFFVTRFKEALFHYSAMFDMLDTTVRRDDPQRLMFEREEFGREILNVIACDGVERVERPETYKQWQSRNQRAGLKQISLDQELLNNVRKMVDACFDKQFDVDVDGNWMLQGWKGRVIFALSCWIPADPGKL